MTRLLLCVLFMAVGLGTGNTTRAQDKPRRLLVIGQSKGYEHDSISTAMATLYNIGRRSHQWETFFRTDCAAITKKPRKWGAKNLDAFDAVAFFTDGDLDMDDSQKADLLSFIREDGKGFIGIHSAAITFLSWPEYGRMLGGRFDGHPWGEFKAPLVVEDSEFPGMRHLQRYFTLHDEIYQIRTSRAKTFACCCVWTLARSTCPGKASAARTRTSRSSGSASTAKGAAFTTAWATAKRCGNGPTSRRCGRKWCAGPWEIFVAMPVQDLRRKVP